MSYSINSFLFIILLTSIKIMADYLTLYDWKWLNTTFAMVTIIINMANNNNPAGALIPLLPFKHRNEAEHNFFFLLCSTNARVESLWFSWFL